MVKKVKKFVELQCGGIKVLEYLFKQSKDGLIFTLHEGGFGGLHLTLYSKNGKVNWHVSDENGKMANESGVIETELTICDFEERVQAIFSKIIVDVEPDMEVYVCINPKYTRKKIEDYLTTSDRYIHVLPNPKQEHINIQHFRKVLYSQLVQSEAEFGFVYDDDVRKFITPFDEKQAFIASETEMKVMQGKILQLLGIGDYLHIIDEECRRIVMGRLQALK